MTKPEPNLFSSLLRYCADQKEHFIGEGLALVLNQLLRTDRGVAIELLNHLCQSPALCWRETDDVAIRAQESAGEAGIPDITIRCADKKAFMELKVDQQADSEQLRRYRLCLDLSDAKEHQLVLLTRLPSELEAELKRDVKELYWHQVRQWLSEAEVSVRHEVSRYLTSSYVTFLGEGGVSMERVDGDYRMLKYAMPQLRNLLDIVRMAKEEGKKGPSPIAFGTSPWGWVGFLNAPKGLWFGVEFEHPLDVTFQVLERANYDMARLESTLAAMHPAPRQPRRSGAKVAFDWDLESLSFFALGLDEQINLIKTIVKGAWEAAHAAGR